MKKKLRLSIDEAGDLGFKFSGEKTSSRFFMMTGVIDNDLGNTSAGDVVNQIAIEIFGKETTKKIHFRNATEQQKQRMVSLVSTQDIKAITVVADKIHFKENIWNEQKYDFIKENGKISFNLYISSLEELLIKASNYAKDENVEFVVDIAECGGMLSKKIVKELKKHLIEEGKIIDCFKSITITTAANRCSLQVADIVTSSIYSSMEPSQLFIPIYAIAFAPIILKDEKNNVLDNGICFIHPYDQDKVKINYPFLQSLDKLYSMLFPERAKEFKII